MRQVLPSAVAARHMTALLPLASGEVLIGTEGAGVLRFDGKTLEPFQPAFSRLAVSALAGDEGEVWIGTRDRGVLRWRAGQTDRFSRDAGLPDDNVQAIALGAGHAYVGTPLGVAVFHGGQPAGMLAAGTFARCLALTPERLMIGTVDQGIESVDLSMAQRSRRPMHEEASPNPFNEASFVMADRLTLALTDGVLRRQDSSGHWNAVRPVEAEAVLSDRDISALTVAEDGRVWAGYFDRGLDVLDLGTQAVTHVEDDRVFCVNRIVLDAGRRTMDIATANCLVLFDPAQARPTARQVLSRRDGLISDQMTDMAFTRGGMTVATPAGLTMFGASGTRSLYSFEGLANDPVYALAGSAESDHLLAGTLGGLSLLDAGSVSQNLTLTNSGLKHNWITAMVEALDRDGHARWLVGTYGGVMSLDAQGHVSAMPGLPGGAVINSTAMLVTSRYVFAGSLSDGLLLLDRATERWTQITAGLPSMNVTAFAEHNGVVYVGTENGLVRVAEARLPRGGWPACSCFSGL